MQIDLKYTYDSIKNFTKQELDFHTTLIAVNTANSIHPKEYDNYIKNSYKMDEQLKTEMLLSNMNIEEKKLVENYFNEIHKKTLSLLTGATQ
jgi:hypothetical protein